MAPAQAQLEARHLPGSATRAELCHRQGAAALRRPRALEGGQRVPLVPRCHAAVVSLFPPGCHHRSQHRRGSCWGAAGAWELQAGHSRVRLDFGLHGICCAHLLVVFHP